MQVRLYPSQILNIFRETQSILNRQKGLLVTNNENRNFRGTVNKSTRSLIRNLLYNFCFIDNCNCYMTDRVNRDNIRYWSGEKYQYVRE